MSVAHRHSFSLILSRVTHDGKQSRYRLSPNLIHNPLSVDKTQDLWDFGVLMVQVIYGADALFRYPTPMSLIVEGTWVYGCYSDRS